MTLRPEPQARDKARRFLVEAGTEIADALERTTTAELRHAIAFIARITAAGARANERATVHGQWLRPVGCLYLMSALVRGPAKPPTPQPSGPDATPLRHTCRSASSFADPRRLTRARADRSTGAGVQQPDLAHLIGRLSGRGDLVVDLDRHPLVVRVARHLGRQTGYLHTDGRQIWLRPTPPTRRFVGRGRRAGLVTVRLPRPDAHTADLHGITHAMHTWRSLLRPGGFLLAALTEVSSVDGAVSHRTTVITAARVAGLYFRQEFLVLRMALPEQEPRALPDRTGCPPPALADGRHDVVHLRLEAFSTAPGGTHV